MAKGRDFENLISTLEAILNQGGNTTVERNVHIASKAGVERQIDVLLTHRVGRHIFKTIIECKNQKKRIEISHIEAFASKIRSVNAHKGILVSKSGFTNGITKESTIYPEISLYTFEELSQIRDEVLQDERVLYYSIKYRSNDWTVKFREKVSINEKIRLYTKFRYEQGNTEHDITEIAQAYLSANQHNIIKRILGQLNSPKQKIEIKIILDINLGKPAYYLIDDSRTYIVGFKSIIDTELTSSLVDIDRRYQYRDVTNNSTIALLYELKLDGDVFQLVNSSII